MQPKPPTDMDSQVLNETAQRKCRSPRDLRNPHLMYPFDNAVQLQSTRANNGGWSISKKNSSQEIIHRSTMMYAPSHSTLIDCTAMGSHLFRRRFHLIYCHVGINLQRISSNLLLPRSWNLWHQSKCLLIKHQYNHSFYFCSCRVIHSLPHLLSSGPLDNQSTLPLRVMSLWIPLSHHYEHCLIVAIHLDFRDPALFNWIRSRHCIFCPEILSCSNPLPRLRSLLHSLFYLLDSSNSICYSDSPLYNGHCAYLYVDFDCQFPRITCISDLWSLVDSKFRHCICQIPA